VAKQRKPNDDEQRPANTAPADSARAEAVEILAGAVFTLLLSGRVPRAQPTADAQPDPGATS
jgi:hypothetical protein